MEAAIGRPSVITADSVLKLEEAFRHGVSVSRACELSGISRATYYKHMQESEVFSDKMTLAQQWPTEAARCLMVEAIQKGDVGAAKWWLERKARDEFGSKAEVHPNPQRQEAESSFDLLKEIATAITMANRDARPAVPASLLE